MPLPADALVLHVVYDHPRDFPNHVVVRMQFPISTATQPDRVGAWPFACLYDRLDLVQRDYRAYGLTWLPRDPGDDPCIVGVWL
jgi:hypothetical protein